MDQQALRAFAMMATELKRILILCKTYPSPSATYAETSCVAGMTEEGELIRLFPVPFRLIGDEQRFRKWQWIIARVEKARDDHGPESYRLKVDTIELDGEPMGAGRAGWPLRLSLLDKLPVHDDFNGVESARQASKATLAMLRPSRVARLTIKPADMPRWTPEELAKLTQMQRQQGLFGQEETGSIRLLEKIPFDFHYEYECDVGGVAKSYRHKLVDWEVGALYRKLSRLHGPDGWEEPFRNKIERELPASDLRLLMGTIHRFPDKWLAVSLIYPPRPSVSQGQATLF